MSDIVPKKERIKNPNYTKFLNGDTIHLLNNDDLNKVLANIKGRHVKEARSMLIALYLTGARPAEILLLKAENITRDGRHLKIYLEGKVKKTLSRTLRFKFSLAICKELYEYSLAMPPQVYLFYHFKADNTRTYLTKKGVLKTYVEYSNRLHYHITKWTSVLEIGEITPYYLRHSRFSQLSSVGATDFELRFMKGSRTNESIAPYQHLSDQKSRSLASKVK